LFSAVRSGDLDRAGRILKEGISIESGDYLGCRALHKAVSNSQLAMAEVLLQKGANVNAQDHKGYTPLSTACEIGDIDEDMVKLLLEHKADTELQTKAGTTDSLTPLVCAIRAESENVVRVLLNA
ncbi:ankyrin, partial [Glonium stellatum]